MRGLDQKQAGLMQGTERRRNWGREDARGKRTGSNFGFDFNRAAFHALRQYVIRFFAAPWPLQPRSGRAGLRRGSNPAGEGGPIEGSLEPRGSNHEDERHVGRTDRSGPRTARPHPPARCRKSVSLSYTLALLYSPFFSCASIMSACDIPNLVPSAEV